MMANNWWCNVTSMLDPKVIEELNLREGHDDVAQVRVIDLLTETLADNAALNARISELGRHIAEVTRAARVHGVILRELDKEVE